MSGKKNPAIVCCRTASMILIVLCHTIDYYSFVPGHQFLPLVFNVGVHSFLLISGYLYGGKTIKEWKSWFQKRWKTVAMPALCMTSIVLLLMLIFGSGHDSFSTILYLLNLQGIGFLYTRFYRYFSDIIALGPLWFITVILLCYCLVPWLQKLREGVCRVQHGVIVAGSAVVTAFAVYLLIGFNTMYFMTFGLGYYISARRTLEKIEYSEYAGVTVFMAAAQAVRLVLRTVIDGSPLYQCYTEFSQMALAIWILYTLFLTAEKFPTLVKRLSENKVILAADGYSFYIYLTHYCFCAGDWNLFVRIDNLLIATVCFAVATMSAAFVLKAIVQAIQRMIK